MLTESFVDRKRIAVVIGTRPEVIKLAPVIHALRRGGWAEVVVIGTGQHRELLRQSLSDFDVARDVDLNIARDGASLAELTAAMVAAMDAWIREGTPDVVVVQGDTNSALAGAYATFTRHIPLAHIEAGLRSGSQTLPFPEEANRRMIAALATWHFAPTERARDNLLREGISDGSIVVTGNTIVDALKWTLVRHPPTPASSARPLLVATLHRRESLGEPHRRVAEALRRIAAAHPDLDVWFPIHPNPAVRSQIEAQLRRAANVTLAEPVGHGEFLRQLIRSRLVLTDSGGVIEEAVSLGVPCLIARETTERIEAIELGAAKLVGCDADAIVREVEMLLAQPMREGGSSIYGDGHASERIATFLREKLTSIDPVDQPRRFVEN